MLPEFPFLPVLSLAAFMAGCAPSRPPSSAPGEGDTVSPSAEASANSGLDRALSKATAACLEQLSIDPTFLQQKLEELTGKRPVQIDGESVQLGERFTAEGKAMARKYLTQEFEALGLKAGSQAYASGVNFVADLRSDTPSADLYILSAHYDTVAESAGADDDGSGMISALAVAKAMTGCGLQHSLRVVGFDEEERGLVGSRAYVEELKTTPDFERLRGVIQLEMTAYDSNNDGRFNIVDCDREESRFLRESILTAMKQSKLQLEPTMFCTDRSDHQNFWDAGKPALVVSELFFHAEPDGNPCYHQICDTTEGLNFEYMTKLTTVLSRAFGALLTSE